MLPTDSVLQPVVLALAFLVPGACAAAGFEWRQVRYSSRRRDWMLRIVVFSALWFALAAWPTYWLVSGYWHAVAGLRPLPGWLYLMPAVYLAAPTAAGRLLAELVSRVPIVRRILLSPIRGRTPWQMLFKARHPGLFRCQLRSGRYVGGLFLRSAPVFLPPSDDESHRYLYFSLAVEFDGDGCARRNIDGGLICRDGGVLVDTRDIETIDFVRLSVANKEG